MTIVYDSKEMERPIDKCVMTIGNFDGIHIGHQKIFKKVKEKAQEIGGTSAIYTFDPHPLSVFQPERSPFLITTFDEKVELIDKVGLDLIVCESYTREFADIDPDQFVEAILVNK